MKHFSQVKSRSRLKLEAWASLKRGRQAKRTVAEAIKEGSRDQNEDKSTEDKAEQVRTRKACKFVKHEHIINQRKLKREKEKTSAEWEKLALPVAPAGTLMARTSTAPRHINFVQSLLPPPELPENAGSRLVHFSGLVQHTVGRGLASTTSKTYSNAWLRYIKFCQEENVDPLAATTDVLAAYLVWVGWSSEGISMPKLAVNALGYYFLLKTGKNPMKSTIVEGAIRGLERDLSKPVKKREGLTPNDIRLILLRCLKSGYSLLDIRFAAAVVLMFHGDCRYEEAVGVARSNISLLPSGNLLLVLLKGKTNQTAHRFQLVIKNSEEVNQRLNPVHILTTYIEKLKILSPAGEMLFPAMKSIQGNGGERVTVPCSPEKPWTADAARRFQKAVLTDLGISDRAPSGFGLHSHRVGGVTGALGLGVPLELVQNQARHASTTTTAAYLMAPESQKARVSGILTAEINRLNVVAEEEPPDEVEAENSYSILPSLEGSTKIRVRKNKKTSKEMKKQKNLGRSVGNRGKEALEVLPAVNQAAFY